MSQFNLKVATRANQASLLPVILVATSINEARPSPVISITYEDTALLHEGEKAIVEFTGVSGTPVYGTEKAIQELRQNFPFLTSKEGKLVNSLIPLIVIQACLTPALGRRMACSVGFLYCP